MDYCNTKNLIRDLGLYIKKIDASKTDCMLYWKDDIDLDYFKFCREVRYKPTRERNPTRKNTLYAILRYLLITPRLQRLYASKAIIEQMTWHANHQTDEGFMCHLSAWRHFDWTYPNFAAKPRNVRLYLCTDEFAPHGQYGHTYSCWPITLTLYNLPLGICMSSDYMFLKMVIHGPFNPKHLIVVYLVPLIKELQNLWHVGVLTRDSVKNETFTIRAALMWTVHDLPLMGWVWMEFR
ncbi:UNVERIFIED_CONTAM: hypothetical protein Slati_3512900 [Sesamum latifolium]|uniref:Uncharacterized protein n=1 Tax=Sesamum latifolium TaxID=2727402 RepID=A0AAW2UIS6_9LAMI